MGARFIETKIIQIRIFNLTVINQKRRIMKSLYITLIFCLFSAIGFSQETFATYDMPYFEEKSEFEVAASEPKGNKTTFYINTYPADRYNDNVVIMLDSKDLDNFKSSILQAKQTYIKWVETAKANNVTELDKEIDIDKTIIKVGFHTSQWYFDEYVRLKARFKIMKSGDYVLIFSNTSKLTSMTNKYIDADGFYLVFQSPEQIDEFLSVLDVENVINYFDKKTEKESLFDN